MTKNTKKTDEFANLTSQLKKKQQEKKTTWNEKKETIIVKPKAKKEETTQTNLRLTISNFNELKKQAYFQDRKQNAITNDALTAYYAACQKWKGQGHDVILSNLLKAMKN